MPTIAGGRSTTADVEVLWHELVDEFRIMVRFATHFIDGELETRTSVSMEQKFSGSSTTCLFSG